MARYMPDRYPCKKDPIWNIR